MLLCELYSLLSLTGQISEGDTKLIPAIFYNAVRQKSLLDGHL